MKKVAVLFSGGKDSCLALFKAKKIYDVKFLLNIDVKEKDSFMFHKPNLKLLKKQAEMLDLPLIVVRSKGIKEEELKDLEKLISKVSEKVEGIVVGGIASSYQGKRIKKICEKLKLKFIAPLWDYSPEKLWQELLKNNFKVIMTKISCEGIKKEWIGKVIDEEALKKLKKLSEKYKFRLDFEGGEAETSVLYMPGMKKEIKLSYDVESDGEHRYFLKDIKIKKI